MIFILFIFKLKIPWQLSIQIEKIPGLQIFLVSGQFKFIYEVDDLNGDEFMISINDDKTLYTISPSNMVKKDLHSIQKKIY